MKDDSQDLVTTEQTSLSKGDALQNLFFRLLDFFNCLQLVLCNTMVCTLNKIEVGCNRLSLNRCSQDSFVCSGFLTWLGVFGHPSRGVSLHHLSGGRQLKRWCRGLKVQMGGICVLLFNDGYWHVFHMCSKLIKAGV